MIAVIFEVQIAEGKTAEYLDIANEIKSQLADIDGLSPLNAFKA